MSEKKLGRALEKMFRIRKFVDSIHLWGIRKDSQNRWVSHAGDLDTWFDCKSKKKVFLDWFLEFSSDEKIRFFVPEVNSLENDLHSIVRDLENSGVEFLKSKP